jgi:predicted O-methyltransferase YrrM
MTTLSSAPLSPLLDRLFAEAEASSAELSAHFEQMSDQLRTEILTSKTNYRDFYGSMKNAPLAVSRETAMLLYMLARSTSARTIIEFGTSFGISTLHLAAALRENGGGVLITSEFEPSKVERARQNFVGGGLSDLIQIREGDALETLGRDLPDRIDLV